MSKNRYLTMAPHIKGHSSTATVMGDVIIALTPALIWACYAFGWRSLYLTLISVASCVIFEGLFNFILRRPLAITDLSAVVTGILLAFCMPVSAPVWFPILGGFIAVVIVKGLFGGMGKNYLNPALTASTLLFTVFSGAKVYTYPVRVRLNGFLAPAEIDGVAGATPLAGLNRGIIPADMDDPYSLLDLFIGNIPGALGEVSKLLLLIGFVYLLVRRVITLHTSVMYMGTVAMLALLLPQGAALPYMASQVFSGGLFLGALFMANDYSTSPVTQSGRILYGIGCGLLTFLFRRYTSATEGVAYAILIMNLLSRSLDLITRPAVFGGRAKG